MTTYWQDHHLKILDSIQTIEEMREIAFDVLRIMPKPVTQVCGPISTGGKGSVEENLRAFPRAAQWLTKHGHNVFHQAPFERPMQRIVKSKYAGYPLVLLEQFYLPIFEARVVHTLAFLPDWQSSFGASWEHGQTKRLGIGVFYIPEDWEKEL